MVRPKLDAKTRTAGQYIEHNFNGKMDMVLKRDCNILQMSNFNGKIQLQW